ncbi:ATP-binding protein [Thiosulfativibrio zosterae]|uniref:Sensory/regulatory protein RpfC n=1 Tax=Thiosulfativibrio zosterae TaxID=2675053 RepID=A0A6F8PKN6_9GAMM|nr:ATP-binding protein [Thiosulfativibrio zosterae]BBP42624.1 hypothetical protein THMIRHAT_03700 [Thiosulfativibrio zosterae]
MAKTSDKNALLTDFDYWESSFGSLQNLIELPKVRQARRRVNWLYFSAFFLGALTLALFVAGNALDSKVFFYFALFSGVVAFLVFWLAYHQSQQQMQVIEEVLRVAQCQQKALDNHAIVSMTNLQGRIVYANSRFIETSGYTKEELVGQTHSIINSGLHDKAFFATLWQTIGKGETWRGVVRNKAKNGTYYWVNSMVMPIFDLNGNKTHYISIRTEITRQKEVEEALGQALLDAQAASRTKSEFLANMSHEIRTPMNGVFGMLQLIREEPLSDKAKDFVDTAMASATSLLRIINDILDVSKIEAGKLTLEMRAFEWSLFVKRVLHPLQLQANAKGLNFTFDIDPCISPTLFGDETRLGQVLTNLVSNAVKFTEQGDVALTFKCLEHKDSDLILQVSVKDSGIGITPEQKALIFDAFSQADATITRKFGGTGLGLSITRSLVEMMGGSLWVESEYGKGSTFFFTTKLGIPKEHHLDSAALETEYEFSLSGVKILLVEDNVINQKIAVALLKRLNIGQIDVADDGLRGIETYQKAAESDQPYDLVLMDMQMPNMDGLEATQVIRSLEAERGWSSKPIIAITANVGEEDRQKCESVGMNGFVGKPFKKDDLYLEIARLLVIK